MKNGLRANGWMLMAILLTASLWAAGANSKTLSFRTAVSVNGAEMKPGFYVVEWVSHSPEATVTFKRNGQVIATASGKWVEGEMKYPADAVVYTNNPDGSHTLKELRFAGSKEVLMFGQS